MVGFRGFRGFSALRLRLLGFSSSACLLPSSHGCHDLLYRFGLLLIGIAIVSESLFRGLADSMVISWASCSYCLSVMITDSNAMSVADRDYLPKSL